jgi:outer membrane biosynthesis protein TonB
MHNEDGPRRLRQGADTPEALLRALNALRDGVDDSARLERVGQKMEALLNAPPPSADSATGRSLLANKPNALKLILAGLAGLGLLAPLFFSRHTDEGTVPASANDGSPQLVAAEQKAQETQPAQNEAQTPELAPVVAPAIDDAVAAQPPAASKRSAKSAHASHARPRKQAVSMQDKPSASEEPASAEPEVGSTIASKDETSARPNTAEPTQAAVPEREAAPAPARPAPQETPRMSEAELLLKARQALKRDPAQTLRFVSEHQTQYQNGRLVPEREVLAIEALRNLGRKAEADERLQKFEARYPSSIHLQRLRESR